MNAMRFTLFSILMLAVLVAAGSSAAQAQRRDCFTDAEIELIRDAQDIDLRIRVLTHAIDRRFSVIKSVHLQN